MCVLLCSVECALDLYEWVHDRYKRGEIFEAGSLQVSLLFMVMIVDTTLTESVFAVKLHNYSISTKNKSGLGEEAQL